MNVGNDCLLIEESWIASCLMQVNQLLRTHNDKSVDNYKLCSGAREVSIPFLYRPLSPFFQVLDACLQARMGLICFVG